MGILHPGITQSSLVLRSEKNPPVRLSILEFDGNFVYLEDLALGISQSIAGLPVVPAGGTGGQVLAKTSGNDYELAWVDQTGGGGGGGNGTNGTSGTSGTSGISGTSGTRGATGSNGTSGTSGINGTDGVGIPAGGTASYILAKASSSDFDVIWIENTGGGGGAGTSGTSGTSGLNGTSGTSGISGTSGTSGISANLESIGNIYSLEEYDFGSLTATSGYLEYGTYSTDINNSSLAVQLPWDINFLGATYSEGSFIYVNSNSYVTFGNSSGASNSIAPGLVAVPAIFLGAGDNSAQTIVWGFDIDDPESFRIRYEGANDESGDGNFVSLLTWEIIINLNTPDELKVVFGTNLRNPGGVYGIGNGADWVERFAALPTYSDKTNTTLNAMNIYSYTSAYAEYSDMLSSIKFVGPGVYRSLSGTTATINIDPLNQFGLAVNYDTTSPGTSVISATKMDLRLTTGKDGGAVLIRPRGNVVLQPYARNKNQFGKGYDVVITASNASQDSISNGDYDGGSIYITPGTGVGTGAAGDVSIGRPGSYVNLLGNTVADAVDSILYYVNSTPGWSGTYSVGTSSVVTVVSGIITNVS